MRSFFLTFKESVQVDALRTKFKRKYTMHTEEILWRYIPLASCMRCIPRVLLRSHLPSEIWTAAKKSILDQIGVLPRGHYWHHRKILERRKEKQNILTNTQTPTHTHTHTYTIIPSPCHCLLLPHRNVKISHTARQRLLAEQLSPQCSLFSLALRLLFLSKVAEYLICARDWVIRK